MSNVMRVARAALVVASLAGAVFAPAKPPKQQLNWWIGQFNYLKRVTKEPNAPANDQPVKLSPDMVRQDLMAVRLGHEEPLFDMDEIHGLVGPICAALAQAGPNEDLIVLSTTSRSHSILPNRTAITARLFVKDGQLNLILHDARFSFYDRYLVTNEVPDFHYGSRNEPSKVQLECLGAGQVRGDWLTFPVVLEVPKTQEKVMAFGTALPAPAAAMPALAPAPAAAVPPASAPAAAPAPAPAPVAAPAPAPAKDQAYYEQQQQRLRALKRMHDDGLITDDEFNAKRKELIEGL
jgi:hypothetical protein